MDVDPLVWNAEADPAAWDTQESYDNLASVPLVVYPTLLGMNYGRVYGSPKTSLAWTAADLLPDTQFCNVLYVHSHGTRQAIWSDSNDGHRSGQYPNAPPPIGPELIWPTGYANSFDWEIDVPI